MEEPIEEAYFRWLCAKVMAINVSNYHALTQILYSTEFIWIISGDRNRAQDGIELREEFIKETKINNEAAWFHMPCSLLEMFIAFSRRAAFQTDTPSREWFWEFLANLKLNEYRRVNLSDVSIIEDILDTFLWRTYDATGYGGMFPMRNPDNDQRKVEIWYQFCEYLDDRGLL